MAWYRVAVVSALLFLGIYANGSLGKTDKGKQTIIERWASRAPDLSRANFSDIIPNSAPTFVFFYSLMCTVCSDRSRALDNVISQHQKANGPALFFRVDGPANPELILAFPNVTYYPALVYFEPNSANVTSVYPSPSWLPPEVKPWVDEQIASSSAKKQSQPDSALSASPAADKATLCAGYGKANRACEAYGKVAQEVVGLREKVSDMRARLVQLLQEEQRHEALEIVRERNGTMQGKLVKKSKEGSLFGGLMVFIVGTTVGFLVCYAVFVMLKRHKRARTVI